MFNIVKNEIKNLLNRLNIKIINEKDHSTGGKSFYFRIFGANYCLFTSCWKDFGLHFVYKTRTNGKEKWQKMIDFQKNLNSIELILRILVNAENKTENKEELEVLP